MKIIDNGTKNAYEKQKAKNICDDLGKIMGYHILNDMKKTLLYGDNN